MIAGYTDAIVYTNLHIRLPVLGCSCTYRALIGFRGRGMSASTRSNWFVSWAASCADDQHVWSLDRAVNMAL